MTKAKKVLGLTCTCCGADITAPKFWKGKPYGFSCYAVVSGEGKYKKGDTFAKIDVACFRVFADEITAEQAMTAERMISVFVICKDGKRRELRARFTGAEPNIVRQDGAFYVSTKAFNAWKDDKIICHYVVDNVIKYTSFFTAD